MPSSDTSPALQLSTKTTEHHGGVSFSSSACCPSKDRGGTDLGNKVLQICTEVSHTKASSWSRKSRTQGPGSPCQGQSSCTHLRPPPLTAVPSGCAGNLPNQPGRSGRQKWDLGPGSTAGARPRPEGKRSRGGSPLGESHLSEHLKGGFSRPREQGCGNHHGPANNLLIGCHFLVTSVFNPFIFG